METAPPVARPPRKRDVQALFIKRGILVQIPGEMHHKYREPLHKKGMGGTAQLSNILLEAMAASFSQTLFLLQPLPRSQICRIPDSRPASHILSLAMEAHSENTQSPCQIPQTYGAR